jgi:hypothetical protein
MLIKMNKPPEAAKELELIVRYWITMCKFYDQYGSFDREQYNIAYPTEATCILAGEIKENHRLGKLLGNLTEERQSIILALENDNYFIQHINDVTYCFAVCNLDESLQTRVYNTFESIYTLIFSPEFTLRATFLKEYKKVNRYNYHVCPACLGYIDLALADMDHYFPKRIYPTLAVNSDNLMPLCGDCNQGRIKGTRKPTDPDKAAVTNFNSQGCLKEIYLPYNHNGDAIDDFAVKIVNREIVITARDENSAAMKKRVDNIVKLFKLTSRWTTLAFGKIEEELRIEIFRKLFPMYNISKTIERSELIKCLQELQGEYQAKSKRISDAFVTLVYIQWGLGEGANAYYNEIVQSLREEYLSQNKKGLNFC